MFLSNALSNALTLSFTAVFLYIIYHLIDWALVKWWRYLIRICNEEHCIIAEISEADLNGEKPIDYFRRMCLTNSTCPKYKSKQRFCIRKHIDKFLRIIRASVDKLTIK